MTHTMAQFRAPTLKKEVKLLIAVLLDDFGIEEKSVSVYFSGAMVSTFLHQINLSVFLILLGSVENMGALEDIPMEEIKSHFETNLFGAIRVMQAVLPIMREQTSGIIVNISSMCGRIAFPLSSTYSGTKFALEGITESLSYEVEQFGIRVILIEPGVVGNNFANKIKKIGKTMKPDSPYSRLVEVREANRRSMVEMLSTTPEEVARVILEAINSDSPDLRYVVGHDALRLSDSRNNMSESEFKRFMMRNFFGISEIPKQVE